MSATESGKNDFMAYLGMLDHKGPLNTDNPKYKGSQYNVLNEWKDGMKT